MSRAEARNASTTPAARRAAAERAVETRRLLLRNAPDDPARPDWLLDQAEDILLLLLPATGSDLSTLFGRAPESEAARSHELVAEALRALRESAAERARPRSRAVDVATDSDREAARRREALLRGVALSMSAEWSPPELATMQRQEAIVALTPLLIDLEPAARRLSQTYLALALSGVARHDEAAALLRVLTEDRRVPAAERFRAELATIVALERAGERAESRRRLDQLVASVERDDLFARLLLTDREVLWRLAAAPGAASMPGDRTNAQPAQPTQPVQPAQPAQPGSLAPWGAYRALFASSAAEERESLRSVVLDRTASLLTVADARTADASDLPPFPALAWIVRLDHAPAQLERYLQRTDLPALERWTASRLLSEALSAAGNQRQAAATLVESARRSRGEPESIDALERAAELATVLWSQPPHEGEEAVARRAFARSVYEVALRELPPNASSDRWRIEAARLALADGRSEEVRSLAVAVAPTSPWWPAASLFLLAADADEARRARSDGTSDLEIVPDDRLAARIELWRTVRNRAAALADAMTTRRDGLDQGASDTARAESLLLLAESHLALDDPAAALAALSRLPQGSREADHATRAVPLRVEALEASGRHDELRALLTTGSDRHRELAAQRATALLRTLEARCAALELAGQDREVTALAQARIAPLATALRSALAGSDSPLSPELRRETQRLVARGELRGGNAEVALELTQSLQREEPDALDLLVTEAEALARLGFGPPRDDARLGTAMLVLKRIAAARKEARDGAFWLAETLQLEILKQVGRSTEQIGPRVEQLRRLDPELGGEGFRRRLERLGT